LALLLFKHRGVRHLRQLPNLTKDEILAWADAHRRRTGRYPRCTDGPVAEAPGETWTNVDAALRGGGRGLSGGSSLPRLLMEERGKRNQSDLAPLRIEQILTWADNHFDRTGKYPGCKEGAVGGAPGERWSNVDAALREGMRGLPGGSSLPELLRKRRGVINRLAQPPLTEDQIIKWAVSHHKRTGRWPTAWSVALPGGPLLQWISIDASLSEGRRGLPGGSSLARLLAERLGIALWRQKRSKSNRSRAQK
jgi:hypothetical protein